jgi:hypothetical protein
MTDHEIQTRHPGKESEAELRRRMLWFAGEIVRAQPNSSEQRGLRERAEELTTDGSRGEADLLAARRLTSRPDPGLRVAFAARDAALETPRNASVLYALIDAFLCSGAKMDGEGPLLRLERWLDAPYAPVIALRGTVEDAAHALDLKPGDVRGELRARGFIDASDPSLPMAALWVHLSSPITTPAPAAG